MCVYPVLCISVCSSADSIWLCESSCCIVWCLEGLWEGFGGQCRPVVELSYSVCIYLLRVRTWPCTASLLWCCMGLAAKLTRCLKLAWVTTTELLDEFPFHQLWFMWLCWWLTSSPAVCSVCCWQRSRLGFYLSLFFFLFIFNQILNRKGKVFLTLPNGYARNCHVTVRPSPLWLGQQTIASVRWCQQKHLHRDGISGLILCAIICAIFCVLITQKYF